MKNSNNIPRLKLCFYFFIFLGVSFLSQAQDFNNYQNIQSNGNIPEDFLTLSSSKYQSDQKRIAGDESKFEKKTKRQFYLESNFMINELLLNGKVLYNDPLGNYVNKVLDELLKNKAGLRKSIRAYVVLSPIVNAYATDNGTLFINIGLLAKLKTEAQLAFVLGHELTHYEKEHVLNRYVHNEKLVKGKITFGGSEVESQLFLKTSYAKEQEMEADLNGVDLILSTSYNPLAGVQVMQILGSLHPFEARTHEYAKLVNPEAEVNFAYKPIFLDSIHEKEVSEEEHLTHPALATRIDKINQKIGANGLGKKDFVAPEQDFLTMTKQAQFELSKLYLLKGNYISALYAAHQLLQDYPESTYLKDILCKAYYLCAKSEQDIERKLTLVDMVYQYKDIQYIYEHLSQMEPAQLNALALMAFMKYSPKPSADIRFRDLLADYKNNYAEDTASYVVAVQNHLKQYPDVQATLAKIPKKGKDIKPKNGKDDKKKVIDNIIVIDPRYKKFDLRKKKQAQYIASEKSLINYHEQIATTAKLLRVQAPVLSPIEMKPTDVQKFQELSVLKNYVEEVFTNGNDIIATDYEKVNQICAKYKSSHIALIGTYTFHMKKPLGFKIGAIVWTGIVFPTLPFGIYYATVPSYRTYNYVMVVNTLDQSIAYKDIAELKFKDSKGAVNASLYYQLLKMRGKK